MPASRGTAVDVAASITREEDEEKLYIIYSMWSC